MRSMTGHGRGSARGVTAELRAVNHRFFDLKLRGNGLDPRVEDAIGTTIRKRAERGAFSVSLRDDSTTPRAGITADVAVARSVHTALEELRVALGYPDPVPFALVAERPEVLRVSEPSADVDERLAAVTAALDVALDELVAMRQREGAALAADLNGRLQHLEQLGAEIGDLARSAPAELQRRLTERLDKLLGDTKLDPSRLAAEVALLADRSDVTEELVRLASHIAQLRALLAQDAPVGRRMDFLVQEVGREINTIGSKAGLVDITRRVVEAKAELEKIREQVQNVE
jgi:uncharacterized protein (TIGR00255 family)